MSAFELFHSYRRGWQDAASSRIRANDYVDRKDLASEYERGYQDGRIAFFAAMNRQAKITGHKPYPGEIDVHV